MTRAPSAPNANRSPAKPSANRSPPFGSGTIDTGGGGGGDGGGGGGGSANLSQAQMLARVGHPAARVARVSGASKSVAQAYVRRAGGPR